MIAVVCMTNKPLNERQRRFVEAYMGEAKGNAMDAARIAGYSPNHNTLHSAAQTLMKDPRIKAAIDERVKADPLVATRESRQQFWTRVMNGEVNEAVLRDGKVHEVPASIEMRLKASHLLGKAQGDFVAITKVEHGGEVRVQHVTVLPPQDTPPDPGPDA